MGTNQTARKKHQSRVSQIAWREPKKENESQQARAPRKPNVMNEENKIIEENVIEWKLTKDLKKAAATLDREQARFLVDRYYQTQENRIRSEAQIRALSSGPSAVLAWFEEKDRLLEGQIAAALKYYAEGNHMGQWAIKTHGIGPIISAGLLAHIDIEKAPTVGHIWRFAGQDPTSKWAKGEKRPWNASLKVICWKIGESFVKVSGNPQAYYGQVYKERKALEAVHNEAGKYADQAKAVIESNPRHAQAAIYKTGKLPPGHIHARAKRYAVKLFLSHWHGEAYQHHFKKPPPLPYPIAILGHAHAA